VRALTPDEGLMILGAIGIIFFAVGLCFSTGLPRNSALRDWLEIIFFLALVVCFVFVVAVGVHEVWTHIQWEPVKELPIRSHPNIPYLVRR
jgi:hypothetical protein